jgi:hypothetical protein
MSFLKYDFKLCHNIILPFCFLNSTSAYQKLLVVPHRRQRLLALSITGLAILENLIKALAQADVLLALGTAKRMES